MASPVMPSSTPKSRHQTRRQKILDRLNAYSRRVGPQPRGMGGTTDEKRTREGNHASRVRLTPILLFKIFLGRFFGGPTRGSRHNCLACPPSSSGVPRSKGQIVG